MPTITIPGMFLTGNHGARPAANAVGKGSVYSCTTHSLIYQSDGSSWTTWATLGTGTGVASDTIWDAKGDLAAGTGADTASKLTVGSNDTILMADSAQSTGLKWVASQTPSTQAFGDAAAEGTADTYARGDHKHAMPASPTGALLAIVKDVTGGNKATTSATCADVDASNAVVTFTAPASGNVLVRATVMANISNAVQNAFLGLREGTTDLVNGTTGTFAMQGDAAAGHDELVTWAAYLTGVSAGSHTYKLSFGVAGGATFTVRQAAASPIILEVWACP